MKPFEGQNVLDLTQSVAGPFATQMLGTMGAHVVKVEPPEGDAFRGLLEGSMFTSVNMGGKRSICVDLKTEAGRNAVRELAERADVVMESFRPGVVDKFGLDYDSIARTNEDVIYVSLSGYGQCGPYSMWPGYDPIIQAMSGVMSMIGYRDRPPVRIGASIIDCGTGVNAAFLIATALLQREQTGGGEYIDISLFEVAISWMHYWITYYSTTGDVPMRAGQGFPGFAPSRVFEAADGEQFYVSIVNDTFYERLCTTVGREDLLKDQRFADNAGRIEHRDVLESELQQTFETYERSVLIEQLVEAGVPAGPLQYIDDIVDEDPHVDARNLLATVENSYAGTDAKVPQLPFEISGERPEFAGAPPELGEDSRAVLSMLGYSEERIEQMLERNEIFEG